MKNLRLFILLILPLLLASCHSRELAYLTDAQRDTAQAILQHYSATIMPGDQLYIYVSSLTPQSVIPFNQETHRLLVEKNDLVNNDEIVKQFAEQGIVQQQGGGGVVLAEVSGYTVNDKGEIIFPVLGKMNVGGLTHDELKERLEKTLIDSGFVIDPIVRVELMNFRVTVVGEVRIPQQIHVQGTRLTILEALAICGDLTDYGLRDKLLVMRFDNGKQEFGLIDLTKKEMLDSPYYYLHNNDIIYVETSDILKRRADRDDNVPYYISSGISLISTVRTIWRTIQRQQNYQ